MKNNKKVMFILIVILLVLIFIFIFKNKTLINTHNDIPSTNQSAKEKSVLLDEGYTEDDITLITSKLSEESIQKLENNKYEVNLIRNLLNEEYFIENNLDRYIAYYNKDTTKTTNNIVLEVNTNLDYDFYTNQVSSNTDDGIKMIANKHYNLGEDFNGLDLTTVDDLYAYYNTTYYLNSEAYSHFIDMWNDANKEGLNFGIYSAYRSYSTQTKLYNNYVARDGITEADTYSARAGNSEHQTGLAVDLASKTKNTSYFYTTNEYTWLVNNSYKYGFILRYPEGKEYITGYQYESWHYRYCGIDCATIIHDKKITFDEYYEFYIKK